VTEDAQDRAAARTGVRAAGAAAAASGAKALTSDDSKDAKEDKTPSRAGMGEIISGKGMKKGGSITSASKRADGCATKGKTKGRFV